MIQARGGGYGLDLELAEKARLKYNVELEQEAQAWIESILNKPITPDFGHGLKDGTILCEFINCIQPNIVPKISYSKMPFKKMENVSAFLKSCRQIGVLEFDLFETVDLYELKDLGHVVRCLHALGRAIQKHIPQFTGPTIGVKESTKNRRSFTEQQLNEAKHATSLLNLGSSMVMERRDIDITQSINFGAAAIQNPIENEAINRPPPPPPPMSYEKLKTMGLQTSQGFIPSDAIHEQLSSIENRPAPPTVPDRSTTSYANSYTVSSQSSGISSSTGFSNDSTPAASASATPVTASNRSANTGTSTAPVTCTPATTSTTPTTTTAISSQDIPEQEAQEWIEAITGLKFSPQVSFGENLKDGIRLCQLMNIFEPNSIRKIETTSRMPFKLMENISAFLKQCRRMGVAEFDLFETVDLFELKNVHLVVKCVHALGRCIQKYKPELAGQYPTLGVKESTVNKRQFSSEQLLQATRMVSKLNLGSSQVMERGHFDHSASVTFAQQSVMEQTNQTNRVLLTSSTNSNSSKTLPTRTNWQ